MTLRADHVAGIGLVLAGLLVFALSGQLPFGSLAFPGAGFLPKLIAVAIIAMGVLLALGGAQSAPFRELGWSDLKHGVSVVAITAAATLLYERLGFGIALAAMMFAVLILVERKKLLPAALYSLGVVAFAYVLFMELRAPMPHGPFGF